MARKYTLSTWAVELDASASLLGKAQRGLVESAAREVKDALNEAIRQDTGGDGYMSRFHSGKGANVRAFYSIIGYEGALARVKTGGPMPILESGSKPHVILPTQVNKVQAKRGVISAKQAKRMNRQAELERSFAGESFVGARPLFLAGPGIWRFRVDHHPGARGKGTFTRGTRIGLARASKQVDAYFSRALKKAFGG